MSRWGLWVVAVVLGLSWACGSVPTPRAGRPRTAPTEGPAPGRSASPEVATGAAARVVEVARSLLAVPYRYAGADTSGFDCSGLTSYVFARIGVRLPRTAQAQASSGRWVAPDELSPGDLVFFGDNRAKPVHVGVVVSAPGEPLSMVHSSSSRGVIETEVLADSYWLPRMRFGRRVLAAD